MTRTTLKRLLVAAMVAGLVAGPLLGDDLGRLLRPGPREGREAADLARQALGADPEASRRALDRLVALAEPARPRLTGVVRRLLERGREGVHRAERLVGDPAKTGQLQEKVNATRAKARANIKVLKKGEPIERARDFYGRLDTMVPLLGKVLEVRLAVRRAMAGREHLLSIWRGLDAKDKPFSDQNEADLSAKAEAVLALPLEEALGIPAFGRGEAPAQGSTAWHLWFYAACRAIETYNASLRDRMSEGEFANVRAVNHYRELLGILPMEVDLRLLQSARRHSKEMADLGYFGHTSPKKKHRTASMRMKQAGYDAGAGENCAQGYRTGEDAFWGWFSSPPHHRNMVAEGNAAFGVGQWDTLWTQNFGRGRRTMLLDEAARRQLAVKGDVLPPRG